MIDIVTAVGSVKSAIDIAKVLKNGADSLGKAEVKLQLAELISSLADVKMQMAEIQEALVKSEKEKKELSEKLLLKEKLVYKKPYYFKINDDNLEEGPFCQRCYDVDSKMIYLQDGNNDFWNCEECKSIYRGQGYEQYKPRNILSNEFSI